MVSAETMLSYPDWKLPFIVYTDASDKYLGTVTIQNNKPIDFFSRRLGIMDLGRKFTTTEARALIGMF